MVDVPRKLHQPKASPKTPPKPAANRKGSPADVPALATIQQAPRGQKVPIQLKIDAETAKQFRVYCAERELDLSEAFLRMFEAYRKIS